MSVQNSAEPHTEVREQVTAKLRKEIICGRLSPGKRIPPQIELARQFGVSGVTVQHAVSRLARDGFLCTRPRQGTYVAEKPPHIFHYGITFYTHPSDRETWLQFWVALSHEAVHIQQTTRSDLSLFYGIDGRPGTGDNDELLRLAKGHQLAGLIFTSNPWLLVNTPLLQEPDIPRVAIGVPKAEFPGVTAVNGTGFEERCLQEMCARGRRRVGLILTDGNQDLDPNAERWVTLARSMGIEMRPEWVQTVPLSQPALARNVAQLLMSPHYSQRPDVLIIADDNLVPAATAGLAAAGLHVPDDADVIAHTNFPWPTPSAVAALRIGFDSRAILEACIRVIDAKRAGKDVPPVVEVTAQAEDEIVRNPSFRNSPALAGES